MARENNRVQELPVDVTVIGTFCSHLEIKIDGHIILSLDNSWDKLLWVMSRGEVNHEIIIMALCNKRRLRINMSERRTSCNSESWYQDNSNKGLLWHKHNQNASTNLLAIKLSIWNRRLICNNSIRNSKRKLDIYI